MIVRGMGRQLSGWMLLFWAAGALAMADDLAPEVVQLSHLKRKMRQVLAQVPNYTCLETIQRYGLERHSTSFQLLDTVFLEVSNVGNKELLAWPGARRFEEADLSNFTAGGMLGSGIFALHARNVFLIDTNSIQFYGSEEMDGRATARYDFKVPQAWSGLQIRANGTSATVGTQGSFWIDPDALELLRMEIRAIDIPAALGIERSVTRIDYARVHIGESAVLLPQSARVVLNLFTGDARRNDIEFSHCREYRTDSSIRFDMPETRPQSSAARLLDLPAGLMVAIDLQSAIDSATAHVGDLLSGRVADDVRRKGEIIIPKGALVSGRIRNLKRVRSPEPAFDITIELAEVEWANTRAELYGELLRESGRVATTTARIPGTGVLHMTGAQFRIAPGFKMRWRTLEPNQRRRTK
jgi:hypothetical protein